VRTEEEVRKEYAHAQQNVNIMVEVCKHLNQNQKPPTERLEWWRGYLSALKRVLKEDNP
jgi:hypothetical protein